MPSIRTLRAALDDPDPSLLAALDDDDEQREAAAAANARQNRIALIQHARKFSRCHKLQVEQRWTLWEEGFRAP